MTNDKPKREDAPIARRMNDDKSSTDKPTALIKCPTCGGDGWVGSGCESQKNPSPLECPICGGLGVAIRQVLDGARKHLKIDAYIDTLEAERKTWEDAPIARRVSDEELANLTFKMSDPIALFKLAENLALDLRDARDSGARLRAALDRCSDFAATLGHENDKLREDQKDWRHPMQKLQNENDALRAAVLDRADKLYASGHYIHANYLYEAHQKSGGVGTKAVADSGAEQCIDRPAARILVRGGNPCIFRGAWLDLLTTSHPLWPVWKRASRGDACVSADGMPDGLYTVVDCEACIKKAGNKDYSPLGCPTCSGTGKTLKRTEADDD